MFTGIVESTGIVTKVLGEGSNKTFIIESPISNELKTDQSLSHNGVCLTVEAAGDGRHQVTAIDETLKKTNLGRLNKGAIVNLERCMVMNGRIDGHIVQGHADGITECIAIEDKSGSYEYEFKYDPNFAPLMIEKGSVCLNGISLTAFEVTNTTFKVAIIPYTYNHTNIQLIKPGDTVNIEFDIVGKYILRHKHTMTVNQN